MKAQFVEAPELARLAGIRHAFFTRRGGASEGLYASLNCGPGSADDAAAVHENRVRAASAIGVTEPALTTAWQVHGRDVLALKEPIPQANRPKVDGFVTDRPGIGLGILAADCTPVLFADAQAGVIGACHAGWKGALAGITDATVEAMEGLGAQRARITAAIGPAIRQASYEVGPELRAAFLAAEAASARFFIPSSRAGHFMFDLTGYVGARLVAAGVGSVADLGLDTRSDPERFYSYRRMSLAGETDYGRQLSAITLTG